MLHDDGRTAGSALLALAVTRETRRVVVTVRSGEEIEIRRVEGREPAVRVAREAIRTIETCVTAEGWPVSPDRFLHPDAIVSVDVQRISA